MPWRDAFRAASAGAERDHHRRHSGGQTRLYELAGEPDTLLLVELARNGELQTPTLIGKRRHWGRGPRAHGATSPPSASDHEVPLSVEPLGLLPVDLDVFPPKQNVQPASQTVAAVRQLAQPLTYLGIVTAPRVVTHACPRMRRIAGTLGCSARGYSLTLGDGRHALVQDALSPAG